MSHETGKHDVIQQRNWIDFLRTTTIMQMRLSGWSVATVIVPPLSLISYLSVSVVITAEAHHDLRCSCIWQAGDTRRFIICETASKSTLRSLDGSGYTGRWNVARGRGRKRSDGSTASGLTKSARRSAASSDTQSWGEWFAGRHSTCSFPSQYFYCTTNF